MSDWTGGRKSWSRWRPWPGKIVSLVGTIDQKDGQFYAHLHMSAGDDQGRVFGGHLNRARISATCEMAVRVLPGRVDREKDPETGLNVWTVQA